MKKEKMRSILEKDTTNLLTYQKQELIESLKKVRNISIKKSATILLTPVILCTVGTGIGLKAIDRQPFIPSTYTKDYYYDYYRYKDTLTISHDDVTKDLDTEYIIVKEPWELKEAEEEEEVKEETTEKEEKEEQQKKEEYSRKIRYYNALFDITNDNADEIINGGYANATKYINELVKEEIEETDNIEYVKETKSGEVSLYYKQFKETRTDKETIGETIASTIFTLGIGFAAAAPALYSLNKDNGYYQLYKQSREKLEKLGYEPPKRKSLKK